VWSLFLVRAGQPALLRRWLDEQRGRQQGRLPGRGRRRQQQDKKHEGKRAERHGFILEVKRLVSAARSLAVQLCPTSPVRQPQSDEKSSFRLEA
jgi:hypothetical protein